jgi:hypothetical protein
MPNVSQGEFDEVLGLIERPRRCMADRGLGVQLVSGSTAHKSLRQWTLVGHFMQKALFHKCHLGKTRLINPVVSSRSRFLPP